MRFSVPFFALLAILVLATPATARPVVLEGTESEGCIPMKVFCFNVVEGELDAVMAGESIELTLRAVGSAPHNVFVTTRDEAATGPLPDTDGSAAFATTTTADPGAEVNVTFVVPEDAEALYLWCDVGNHEAGGMWLTARIVPATGGGGGAGNGTGAPGNGTEEGGDEGSAEGDDDSIPVPWFAPILALALVAAARRVRA